MIRNNILYKVQQYIFQGSLVLMGLFFYSCEKEELPVSPHDPGDVITNSVKMESDYRNQLFFDLETNSLVKQNHKVIWDLGFETSPSGNKIILNGAKFMKAANTQISNFNSVIDTIGLTFKIDMPSGSIDSTAIENWISNNIYVIDRGYNELGVHQGFCKIEFLSVNASSYVVHFSKLDGTNDFSMTIPKDFNYNFTFLSLNGNLVSVEPPKENWDLAFTQFTHYYYNDGMTYLVTGCLSNRNKVEVAPVFDKPFAAITLNDVNNYSFSKNTNTIGFDWKEYDFNTGSYLIFSNQNYIIKSTEGKYFKLHFIDFYDTFGVKGTPTFEFQEL